MTRKESMPPIPEFLIPTAAVSLRRSADNKGYVLTVTSELEFPNQEPIWSQFGYYLTDYELQPFLATVDRLRDDEK